MADTKAATIVSLLQTASHRLDAAGLPSPRLDAQVLLAAAMRTDRLSLLTRNTDQADAEAIKQFDHYIDRRLRREPVSQILGYREFWGLDFKVTADTLSPRPDSETLIAAALDWAKIDGAPDFILDLGTGTGCLLLALLSEFPQAFGIGIDRSEAAARVARHNAKALGLDARASILVGDWADALASGAAGSDGRLDMIISNPPYITAAAYKTLDRDVAAFEPITALVGGDDGLDAYRTLLPGAWYNLRPGGLLLLEIGYDQGQTVPEILKKQGFDPIWVVPELERRDRAVLAIRP